jgi:hypothetical protein
MRTDSGDCCNCPSCRGNGTARTIQNGSSYRVPELDRLSDGRHQRLVQEYVNPGWDVLDDGPFNEPHMREDRTLADVARTYGVDSRRYAERARNAELRAQVDSLPVKDLPTITVSEAKRTLGADYAVPGDCYLVWDSALQRHVDKIVVADPKPKPMKLYPLAELEELPEMTRSEAKRQGHKDPIPGQHITILSFDDECRAVYTHYVVVEDQLYRPVLSAVLEYGTHEPDHRMALRHGALLGAHSTEEPDVVAFHYLTGEAYLPITDIKFEGDTIVVSSRPHPLSQHTTEDAFVPVYDKRGEVDAMPRSITKGEDKAVQRAVERGVRPWKAMS